MRKLIALAFCIMVVFSISMPVFAVETVTDEVIEIAPRAEVTEWIYRNNNGVIEKRLWSVTYGYWKTEWAPII